MKIFLVDVLLILAVVSQVAESQTRMVPRSLEGLVTETVSTAIDANKIRYTRISDVFTNVDWNNDTAASNALKSVHCNDLCDVCCEMGTKLSEHKCENYCEDECGWDYMVGDDENTRSKRGLIDFCLGFPDGFRFDFGGIGQLLSAIPLVGK